MKAHNFILNKTVWLFALALCFLSCKKEVDTTKYPEFPINLTYELTPAGLKLKWNPIQTSDFVQYIVIRTFTNDTIKDIPANTPVTSISSFTRIADPIKTEFIDQAINSSSTVTSKVNYRIFAQLGNRFVSSRNIVPFSAIPWLNAIVSDMVWLPKTQSLFLVDKGNSFVHKIDLQKDTIEKSLKCLFVGSQYMYIDGGLHNGVEELYVPQSTGHVYVINPITLAEIDRIPYSSSGSGVLASVITDNNGTLFTSMQSPFRMSMFNRQNKNIVAETDVTNNTVRLRKMSSNKLVGVPMSSGYMFTFDYNTSAKTLNMTNYIYLSASLSSDAFEVSTDGNFFIVGSAGVVYNKNLQLINQLSNITGSLNYVDFAFSADGKKLYAANSISTRRQIDVINTTNFTLEKTIPIRTMPRNIVVTEKQIIIFSLGTNPVTGAQGTLIEKIDL